METKLKNLLNDIPEIEDKKYISKKITDSISKIQKKINSGNYLRLKNRVNYFSIPC